MDAYSFETFFPIIFIFFWLGICKLLSVMGGWISLAGSYRLIDSFDGTKWHLQYARIGKVQYKSCLTVGANERGLYLNVLLPFRFGHPPLLIPWTKITGKEAKGWVYTYVDLAVPELQGDTIRIFKGLADRLETACKGTWTYERLSGVGGTERI